MDPGVPSFEYIGDTSNEGVFAFSFYFPPDSVINERWRNTTLSKTENVYLRGIQMYLDSIKRESSVFQKWKVVLYTDEFTFNKLSEYKIFKDEPIVYAIVKWDEYAKEGGSVKGDVLRVMRFRAFFDFPTVPVFVRDADTLFAIFESETRERIMNMSPISLYEWEKAYLEGAMNYPNTLIFGTSLNYVKFWHKNKVGTRHIPLGAFAGLMSAMPSVPCFQKEDLWFSMMDYIKEAEKKHSGDVGKDEQILLLKVLPECIDHVFFFELDMSQKRGSVLKERSYSANTNYPTIVFERGSNKGLKEIFETKNQLSSEKKIDEIKRKNKKKEVEFEQQIQQVMNTMNSINIHFKNNKDTLDLYVSTGIPRAILTMKEILKNEELNTLYEEYEQNRDIVHQQRLAFVKSMKRKGSVENSAEQVEALKQTLKNYDTSLVRFLEKVLQLKTKEDLLKSIPFIYRDAITTIDRLLQYKETGVVPPPPPPPPPPPKLPTQSRFSFLMGAPKQGGTRRKQRRRSLKNLKSRKVR